MDNHYPTYFRNVWNKISIPEQSNKICIINMWDIANKTVYHNMISTAPCNKIMPFSHTQTIAKHGVAAVPRHVGRRWGRQAVDAAGKSRVRVFARHLIRGGKAGEVGGFYCKFWLNVPEYRQIQLNILVNFTRIILACSIGFTSIHSVYIYLHLNPTEHTS